jgi:O-antigen/teichoic acid export membrane protein
MRWIWRWCDEETPEVNLQSKNLTSGCGNNLLSSPKALKGNFARNTAINFIGQFLPLLAGAALIPFILRNLGADRFGVLGIVWVVYGYFTMFDFGLGRATTKLISEWLVDHRANRIPEMTWASLVIQLALGILGCIVLIVLTPLLVGHVLKVPASLTGETKATFLVLAATLPAVLITSGLRSILEGCQRFDLSNLLRIPMNALTYVLPAVAIPLGLHLPGIMLLLAGSRIVFAVIHFFLCARVLPFLTSTPKFDSEVLRPLLSFGGWVTLGNLINPVLVYLDRFLIGSLLSMALVGYYVAPFEGVTKLWLIPASLTTAIFPACSAIGLGKKNKLEKIYVRCVNYLFLVLAPICLMLFIYAKQITRLWLGPEFVVQSSAVIEILVVGVFVNSFAHIPYCFLQALGRPDAAAKVFAIELVPYALFAWWMIRDHGIVGAAAAWSIRVAIEVCLLLFVTWRVFGLFPINGLSRKMFAGVIALVCTGLVMTATNLLLYDRLIASFGISVIWIGAFAWVVWRCVLDSSERLSALAAVAPLRNALRGQRENW